jgi:hypothetical protein
VFLDVKDAREVLAAIDDGTGLFVPTRLGLALGSVFVLALRLPKVSRAVEIPMLVLGRRLPRGGSLLSAGVTCKPPDPHHPMLVVLREVAGGKVVDLEARIQEGTRVPASTTHHTTADVLRELHALLEGPAQISLDTTAVQRGDRVALTFASHEHGVLLTAHVLVKSIHARADERVATVELLDGKQREVVIGFITRIASKLQRA